MVKLNFLYTDEGIINNIGTIFFYLNWFSDRIVFNVI